VHGRLSGALVSGEVKALAHTLPVAARGALTHAYRVGFTGALGELLVIGSAIALAGSFFALVLVRGRDLVAPDAAPAAGAASTEAAWS
jgi:hypothetical protein